MKKNSTILFSMAHPDDESFMVAGVACKYAAQGVRLVLSTATLGEEGKVGEPPICSRKNLGTVRERELRQATDLLGIHFIHLLGFKDRKLSVADPKKIRKQLIHLIRLYQPNLVITFDPNGFNLHPDHIAISRFTSDAIAAAADPNWLPNEGNPHQVERLLWTSPLIPEELGHHEKLVGHPGVDFIVDVKLWAKIMAAALKAHRTQHLSIDRIWFDLPNLEIRLSNESFRQAWGPLLKRRPQNDLFVGMNSI